MIACSGCLTDAVSVDTRRDNDLYVSVSTSHDAGLYVSVCIHHDNGFNVLSF